MNDMDLQYRDFHGYEELAREPAIEQALIRAYQKIFGGSDVWAETYTDEEVHQKLRDELALPASLRVVMRPDTGEVVAFFWAQYCGLEKIRHAIGSIKFSESLATPELKEELRAAIGEREVIYVHDFGILEEYRGRISLLNLICPTLYDIAARRANGRVLFWSVPGTRVGAIAKRVGFDEVLVTRGLHFHLGEFSMWAPCDGVNLPWQRTRTVTRGSTIGAPQ